MSKKIVLKVELRCEKCKTKVMKTVAGIEGVESVQVDMKEQKVTVIGDEDVDPVYITNKLRKFKQSEIVSVGPAKEPEKKQPEKKKDEKDEKKEAPKKEADKKDQATKTNPAPNITYVYLPHHCEPWCGYYHYYY